MNSLKKIISGAALAPVIGGTMAATPAAAWGDLHDNGAAIAGAAIEAAASQPRCYDDHSSGRAP